MSALETARQYIERGWAVVPVPHRAKGPTIEGWQRLQITADDAPRYFNGAPQNVGVLLGEKSGGLVDLDLDAREVVRLAHHFCPVTLRFGRAGNLGSHALVCGPGAVTKKFSLPDEHGGMVLEIRSTGCQTIFPGSVHPNGEKIEFENELPLAEVTRAMLEVRCAQWAAAAVFLRHWTKGHRDDLAAALAGALLRAGWKPEQADHFIGIIADEAGDEKARDRLKAGALARRLKDGGRVPGVPKLREMLGAAVTGRVVEWLALKGEPEEEQKPLRPLVVSASELSVLSVPPRETVVESWLLLPSLILIWALRGLGKTWLALELARAIATGEKFLAWAVPKARRVLYVDGEMPLTDLKERLAQLCATPPALLDFLPSEMLFRDGQPLNLNSALHQARIIELLDTLAGEGRAPEVVIFDNLSSLAGGTDENSNSEIESLLRFLIGLRHRGLAVILIHHAKKGGEDQRGASRREDLLDTSVKLAPPDADGLPHEGARFVVTFTKTRGPRPKPDVLDVALDTGPDGRVAWTITNTTPEPAKWIRTLKAVADHPGETQAQIADRLGVSGSAVSQQLAKAREKELLIGMDVTASGRAYLRKVYGVVVQEAGDASF